MRAIDTNVLVRLIVRDERKQAELADAFIAKGAWVSHLVLAEACRVLDSVYGLKPAEIATAVEMLLDHRQVVVQDAEVVADALARFRKRTAIGFTDCLIVAIARKNGQLPLGTFDRDLARLDDVQRIG
jgi:predicted nucleic-acid-binding protein